MMCMPWYAVVDSLVYGSDKLWSVVVCVSVTVDRVFDEHASTEEIHRELISPIIMSVMDGIHGQYTLSFVSVAHPLSTHYM